LCRYNSDAPPTARRGDIVRWSLPLTAALDAAGAKNTAGEPGSAVPAIEAAREAGIVVEVGLYSC
jgi:hypothetical protein